MLMIKMIEIKDKIIEVVIMKCL